MSDVKREALHKDAERYRALRDSAESDIRIESFRLPWPLLRGQELDAVADQIIERKEGA